MISVRIIFAYLVYALLAAALFLVVLFPDQAVTAYMDARLAAIDPSLTMQADSVRPTPLPPGLKMTAVTLIRANVRLAHFDDAQMSPDLSTLLQEKKQLRFQARLADGSITGRVSMTGTAASGPVQAEADLSEIQLDQLDAIKTLDRFGLSGSLKGRINYDGSRAPAGMANALLTVTKLSITLNAPFFGITDFVMDQTNADFSVSGGILRLKSLTFDGPMLEGKISGTIELRNPIEQSRLSLTGNAKPRPELFARLQETIPQGVVNTRTLESRGVSFRVRGSIDSPDVTMR